MTAKSAIDLARDEIQGLIDEALASGISVPFEMESFIAERKAAASGADEALVWVDPDDAPELDDDFFANAIRHDP